MFQSIRNRIDRMHQHPQAFWRYIILACVLAFLSMLCLGFVMPNVNPDTIRMYIPHLFGVMTLFIASVATMDLGYAVHIAQQTRFQRVNSMAQQPAYQRRR